MIVIVSPDENNLCLFEPAALLKQKSAINELKGPSFPLFPFVHFLSVLIPVHPWLNFVKKIA
jgi:hypothetical protein